MKKVKHSYTEEFRKQSADLVIKQGYTIVEAAKNLGINYKTLGNWVSKYGGCGSLSRENKAVRHELAHLRKEVKKLRLEREILKNAAAFFAKEIG